MKSRSAAAGLLDSPDDHVRGFRRTAGGPGGPPRGSPIWGPSRMRPRSAAAGLLDSPDDHVRGFRRVAEAPYHRGNLAAVVRLVIHDVPDDHPEWGRLLLAFQVLPDERARERS